MAEVEEVIFTSDTNSVLWSCCVWDLMGTTLMTYKGEVCGPRTLSLIGEDYLISSINDRPVLQVWSLGRMEQMQKKMVCPGRVTSLAVSPDGIYCVAGIEEKIHIWQISTGNLMFVNSRHYQSISCLKFTDDGSHFVSAGDDGLVLLWSLASALSQNTIPDLVDGPPAGEPRYVWSHHSMPVTDIHCGTGGLRARLATCSLDQTCKLYELASGQLLISLIMDVNLTSVTMDSAEYFLFLGTAEGSIYQVNLFSMIPIQDSLDSEKDKNVSQIFSGHSKQVVCLSVSMDGQILLSGSLDNTARLWNIPSKQCIRTLQHKGPLTNAFFMQAPEVLFNHEKTKPTLSISTFKRHLYLTDDSVEDIRNGDITLITQELLKEEKSSLWDEEIMCKILSKDDGETKEDLKEHIEKLHQVNHQLYAFSVNSFLNSLSEK